MPNGVPKRGAMCEENPTPDNTTGPKAKKINLKELNRRVIRDSLFDQLARYPHDTQEVDGKQVHDYHCRRCAMTVRLNGLRNQFQVLVRGINEALGQMQSDPSGK
jgi:hypothetical protein